jgi:hypothetical protein
VYDLLNSQKEQAFSEPLQLNEDIRVRRTIKVQVVLINLTFNIEEGVCCEGAQGICGGELRGLPQAAEIRRVS